MKKCNKCNFDNNKEAEFCENCGNSLTVISTVEETETNFCPECGEKLELNSVFCSKCGHSFGAKCSKCKTTNVSDAKFCENCSEPLEWICPMCKNKNQAGAMFCAECGSDSIIGKTKKWKILSAVAVVFIIFSFVGVNISQFNTAIDKAISYGDDNDFNSANTFLRTAQNSWLPFTDSKIQKTKNYINSQEEKCLLLAQQHREQEEQRKEEKRAKKAFSDRKSSSNSNRNYNSSNSSNKQQTYEKFASVDFEFYGSVKDATLSVQSLNNNEVKINDGDSCYLMSSGNGINGTYSFSWTFDSNNNFMVPAKYKILTGKFNIDGLHKQYLVYVSVDYSGWVSIEVKGY